MKISGLWTLIALLIVTACPLVATPASAAEPSRHVLIIGIDGCMPDAILAARAPA